MLNVKGTIINAKTKNLIGLVLEGKHKDFGEFGGNEVVTKALSLDNARKFLTNCRNFNIKSGRIMSTGKQKLSDLKMYLEDGTEIPSGLALVSRITNDNKIIGFDIKTQYNDEVSRYRYQDVVTLSGWFRPVNFIVKFTEDGKAFISGKPGVLKLNDLPEVKAVQQSKRAAAGRVRGTEKPAVNRRTGVVDTKKIDRMQKNYLDIFTIMDAIREADGIVIYLSGDKYSQTLTSDTKTGSDFLDLGIGLIGKPYLDHSIDKMKVNILFKRPGTITLSSKMPVYTFTYSSRTIIKNGANNIKRLGIAVRAESADKLLSYFSHKDGEMHISEITDKSVVDKIERFTRSKNLRYFTVDISKVDVMSRRRAEQSVLTHQQIYDMTKSLVYEQMLSKGLKKAISTYAPYKEKEVCDMYAGLSEAMLNELTSLGVNISNGAYTVTEKSDTVKGNDETDSPINLKYSVKGYTLSGPTADDLANGTDKAMKSAVYRDIIAAEGSIEDMVQGGKVESARQRLAESDKRMSQIKRALWMHNAAMLQANGYKSLSKAEADNWEQIPSRAASTKKYASKKIPELQMDIGGITLG